MVGHARAGDKVPHSRLRQIVTSRVVVRIPSKSNSRPFLRKPIPVYRQPVKKRAVTSRMTAHSSTPSRRYSLKMIFSAHGPHTRDSRSTIFGLVFRRSGCELALGKPNLLIYPHLGSHQVWCVH